MFVFRREDLPADPEFPADLEKLGYYVNDRDQIRKISNPDEDFQYKINKNPRWNEMQREAMNICIRDIVSARLRSLGLVTLKLPLLSTNKDPHVPILVSANLSTAPRVIVVFGEPVQDIGIWAYRSVGADSIDTGSAVAFARAVLEKKNDKDTDQDKTALILANTGQLIWHCGTQRAITMSSWMTQPRASAVDPPLTMTRRNKIPDNGNWQEHVDCVFEEILASRGRLLRQDVKIDIVGAAEGGLAAIRYLACRWDDWSPFISSICLTNPLHVTHLDFPEDDDPQSRTSFSAFISSRCRAYVLSDRQLGLPVPGFRDHGCNCYSSGEKLNIECIMPSAWGHMLAWLDEVYANKDYCEERLEVMEGDDAEVVSEVDA